MTSCLQYKIYQKIKIYQKYKTVLLLNVTITISADLMLDGKLESCNPKSTFAETDRDDCGKWTSYYCQPSATWLGGWDLWRVIAFLWCRTVQDCLASCIYIFIRQKGSRNKWKKHQTHYNNKKHKKPLSPTRERPKFVFVFGAENDRFW